MGIAGVKHAMTSVDIEGACAFAPSSPAPRTKETSYRLPRNPGTGCGQGLIQHESTELMRRFAASII